MTAGRDNVFLCLMCIRRVWSSEHFLHQVRDLRGEGRRTWTHREEKDRLLYNWHHQSIITVIMTVLPLVQLQNGPEVFVTLCVQFISVDYVKSRLRSSNECNYRRVSAELIEKEASV